MIDKNKLNEIIKKIAAKFNPEKIILFGSYATNHTNSDSDIDLLIIKETNQPFHKRSIEIQKSLIGSMVPMDILVYTASEFEQSQKDCNSFIHSAIKTSSVLYER